MSFNNPSIQDFKDQFFRDFPYGTNIDTSVTDQDIANAFLRTNTQIVPDYFGDQSSYSIYYNLLAAHYLVSNLQASSIGAAGGYSFLEASKSVGSVSQSFSIPQRFLDDPLLGFLAKTNYGAQYLAYIIPQMTGQIFSVPGRTRA